MLGLIDGNFLVSDSIDKNSALDTNDVAVRCVAKQLEVAIKNEAIEPNDTIYCIESLHVKPTMKNGLHVREVYITYLLARKGLRHDVKYIWIPDECELVRSD